LATLTFIAASGDTFPKQIALKFADGINVSGQYGIQVLYTWLIILSVILSKALLLADDVKIKDETIRRQL